VFFQFQLNLLGDFKEITDPQTCLEGVYAELLTAADLTKWRVYLTAPSETPFEGGIFETHITFPPEYPMV
jgi:ubiquitin-protein ligase